MHFAVAMRYMHRYVAQTTCDVLKPNDVVVALWSNGGVVNTISELIDSSRRNEHMGKWLKGAGKGGTLRSMGRIKDLRYGEKTHS